ncbi:MAG: molybdenum cofactor guanylyltransferase [Chloroflexi bacterium]|nr:molybdenum cofactor guanylyltransferase [Chloroflexota bacterium]
MTQNQVSVAIMAGGKSSRMGMDKSFVLFEGRPMIELVCEVVADLGVETLLITNRADDYAYLGLPMVADLYPDHGPLGGIFTAVQAATYFHTLIVACDMPWLNRPLLEYMLTLRETADVIVPRWGRYPEPLHAIYSKVCLPPIEEKLKAQWLKITGFFSQVNIRFVAQEEIEQFDENGRSFANINSPDDLMKAGEQ